jgi:DNA-binding transcriptional LysR family regulator
MAALKATTLHPMELRHLRYFLAVAESLSFTRAAVALNVTQPTLSQQIRQLEDGVGCALLDRVGRHVRLTAAGDVFREHAQRVLNEIDAAENALAELQGLMRGTLRIGVFQSFNSSLLPPILGAFSEAYPDIRVVVRQLPTREMEAHLVRGDLDLGIAYVTPESSRIESEKLFEEAMTLVVSDTHRYARRREITAGQLAPAGVAMVRGIGGGTARAHRDRLDRHHPCDRPAQQPGNDPDPPHGGHLPAAALHPAETEAHPQRRDPVVWRPGTFGRRTRDRGDDPQGLQPAASLVRVSPAPGAGYDPAEITLPGFMMPCGSSTCFSRRITSSSTALL